MKVIQAQAVTPKIVMMKVVSMAAKMNQVRLELILPLIKIWNF